MEADELKERLAMLAEDHRNLDVAIAALAGTRDHDEVQLARLKKRKLRLRDDIAALRDLLLPDIIA